MIAAVCAGLVFWLGLCISLAMLPVGFAAALLAGGDVWTAGPGSRRARLVHIGSKAAVTFGVMCVAVASVWLATGMNLLEVWAWNYRNHAAFYAQFPRTWWKWLLVNPAELAVAAGLPLAALVVIGWFSRTRAEADSARPSASSGLPIGLVVTWLALWLSGKNSGEAARLWIFLMPWLCVLAARALGQAVSRGDRALPVAALVCQLACSAILTLHVSGFLTGVPSGSADSPAPAAANR